MEQHPIPQNVSSYQFKLVGDMTLKQFFQVAGGVLIGIIFYSTPLLPIIRLPLAGISVLLGVGLAFLPFEERPLERWIFAFFRAIYSPTVFTWQKDISLSKLFQDELTETSNSSTDTALKDYLSKNNQAPVASTNLDKAEGFFLKNLGSIIGATPMQNQNQTVSQNTLNAQPQNVNPPTPMPTPTTNESEFSINNVNKVQTPVHHAVVEEQNVSTPTVSVEPTMAGNNIIPASQAMFSPDASPPSVPNFPNVVVGQIVDQDRKIVEGAIMEIRDSAGRPIRALRSNKLGHFITVTQMDSGHYDIIIEKDGYEFSPISFEATGVIIPPILVRGKRLSPFIPMPDTPVKPAYSIN